ncbi:MAG: SoxR reducing system RseC family protein [Rhodocyclaceae bacterium]|nr:SoxR reducing system RseC family protein [Rhodocyclaceae bacterium]
MDQEAVVMRVEGSHALVEVAGAGCGRCHETDGCQSGIMGRVFSDRPRQFRLPNGIGAAPGQQVVVRTAEGATLRAALLAYVLPVLSLLAGAWVGTALGQGDDLAGALGALGGLLLGVLAGPTFRNLVGQPVLLKSDNINCTSKEACR